jgi:hypothetical protein
LQKNKYMIEILRHTFGLCGEGHPSLLCILGLGPVFFIIRAYVKLFYSKVICIIKFGLKRVYRFLHYNQKYV